MEECNEVAQAAAKCLRFGVDNTHPVFKTHNTDKLFDELFDIEAVSDLLAEEMGVILTTTECNAKKRKKCKKVEKYILESTDLRVLAK